ncbi:uncharacterized protein [Solanum lycopersicum]|uniref:Uncharacterized protein n=1 Tax=Solanum lycopersicum TaxID=4081 RepID=A0A494G9J8_SOLLC|nr:uncharacterized protein LOC101246614 [Solanum lycopersicum]
MSFRKDESDNSSTDNGQIMQIQLKIQFHSTIKGDLETIESYVQKLKSIANSLAEINNPISNSDMVLQLLAGLPTQYSPFKNTISSMCPLPDFEQASSMLYMQHDLLSLQDREEEKLKAEAGAEKSSGFCTADTFHTVIDTLSIAVAAVGAVGTVCAAASTLGTVVGAVGTVTASRVIVVGAITAVAGWKIWQTVPRK